MKCNFATLIVKSYRPVCSEDKTSSGTLFPLSSFVTNHTISDEKVQERKKVRVTREATHLKATFPSILYPSFSLSTPLGSNPKRNEALHIHNSRVTKSSRPGIMGPKTLSVTGSSNNLGLAHISNSKVYKEQGNFHSHSFNFDGAALSNSIRSSHRYLLIFSSAAS